MPDNSKKQDLEWLKRIITTKTQEVSPTYVKPVVIKEKKKPLTRIMKDYQAETGRIPRDVYGEPTLDYQDWLKTTQVARTVRKKKVTTTVVEEEAIETTDLSPLIRENISVIRNLTKFLKSMDSSLRNLTREPIKIEIVKKSKRQRKIKSLTT
jgi:hypothetical protein